MTPKTLVDLRDRLLQVDELLLVEMLGLTSEDLLNRFDDIVEEKFERLCSEVDWDSEGEEDDY